MSEHGMDRRSFLAGGVVGAGGLLAASGSSVASDRRQEGRPNILWFISDDASPYPGAYGDPVARTPAIDRLAAEGVRYESAYCDGPVCAPARFSLITGLHSATAGPAHRHVRPRLAGLRRPLAPDDPAQRGRDVTSTNFGGNRASTKEEIVNVWCSPHTACVVANERCPHAR